MTARRRAGRRQPTRRPPSRWRPPSPRRRRTPAAAVAGAGDEVAPLAGTVQSVDVTVGQTVAVGDKIAIIEAMKMKTEVHARGAGKVVSIAVKPGDGIDTGGVLLTLA